MLTDRELWACATLVEQRHGDRAPFLITDRMLSLAAQGDEAAVAMWKAISDRFDQLRRSPDSAYCTTDDS
jgi:hypothetical protein